MVFGLPLFYLSAYDFSTPAWLVDWPTADVLEALGEIFAVVSGGLAGVVGGVPSFKLLGRQAWRATS